MSIEWKADKKNIRKIRMIILNLLIAACYFIKVLLIKFMNYLYGTYF